MKNPWYLFLSNAITSCCLIITFLAITIFNSNNLTAQDTKIFGGDLVDISSVPYQISLEGSGGTHICGGVILNCEWVLTANHCVELFAPQDVRVHAGSTDQSNNNIGQRVLVDKILHHPMYSDPNNYAINDIALLHLANPLSFNNDVQPIDYATPQNTTASDLAEGTIATISGWGDTGNGNYEPLLSAAQIPIITNADANTMVAETNACMINVPNPINNSMISFFEEGISSGTGDSGGPAVITLSSGEQRLIGVTSFKGGCPSTSFPSIYADVWNLSGFIDDKIAEFSIGCCQEGSDLHINDDTVYEFVEAINGNLIVHTGATLTVRSIVQFNEDKHLVVERGAKLILEGGTLTKCADSDSWGGVIVEGNALVAQPEPDAMPTANQSGIVYSDDDAVIEWAEVGIAANAYGTPSANKNGGLVYAKNTTFRNNKFGASFSEYNFDNKSEFFNCLFDGNLVSETKGVIIEETDGIDFEKCELRKMAEVGIQIIDAGVNVINNNKFNNNDIGVSSTASSPFSDYVVIGSLKASNPNYFEDNRIHVNANASSLADGLKIVYNVFSGADVSIALSGPTNFNIEANTFLANNLAISAHQTGAFNYNAENYIQHNSIAGDRGIEVLGSNRELQFLCNEFDTSFGDFTLSNSGFNPGEITQNQGSPSSAAGNCFTYPGTISDIITAGSTVHFNYYRLVASKCFYPVTPGNYTAISTTKNKCGKGIDHPSENIVSTERKIVATKFDQQSLYPSLARTEKAQRTFHISPNPSSGTFEIKIAEPDAGSRILISSVLGNSIYKRAILEGEQSLLINDLKLNSGVYFISLINNNGSLLQSERLIIQ